MCMYVTANLPFNVGLRQITANLSRGNPRFFLKAIQFAAKGYNMV